MAVACTSLTLIHPDYNSHTTLTISMSNRNALPIGNVSTKNSFISRKHATVHGLCTLST